ncbi:MAG: tetratricopeptide repeat protein [bacterium]
MSHRLKIKIVVGHLREQAMISLWESIAQHHDVELLTQKFDGEEIFNTCLPVVEFPVIADMPGFFRDLDSHLRGADLIIGVESSRLYSFQALRIARKLGIPFVAMVHEYEPFIYEKFQNIRAVQHDIHANASMFLATSSRAAKLLELEGVDSQKIRSLVPATDASLFEFSEARSQKFRKYTKIPADAIVLGFKGDLNQIEPALVLGRGLRLALNKLDQDKRAQVRLLICGNGAQSEKIKYEIADMGLGSQTLFLSQDPTPFLRDLLCAVDVMIEGRGSAEGIPSLPWHVISAAYSGARFVLPSGSISDDVLSGHLVRKIDDFTPIHLSEALVKKINDGRESADQRAERARVATQTLALSEATTVVLAVIEEVGGRNERRLRRQGLLSFVKQYQIPISFKDANEVLMRCEEMRDFSAENEARLYSEILRIRGDALMALSRNEEAAKAFEDALKQNLKNHHALRGLGYLAWQGHSHEDAMRFFKRALAVDPNDYQSLVGVGLVYRRLQMFNESVYWLHKAVSVGGLESTSLSLIVQACLENAENEQSIGVLKYIRENIGDHPNLSRAIEKLESHH